MTVYLAELVMTLMASFCAVCFPTRFLDEIWDLIESVSEGFSTYSWSSTTRQCYIPNIKHLSTVVLKKKSFEYFSMYF